MEGQGPGKRACGGGIAWRPTLKNTIDSSLFCVCPQAGFGGQLGTIFEPSHKAAGMEAMRLEKDQNNSNLTKALPGMRGDECWGASLTLKG